MNIPSFWKKPFYSALIFFGTLFVLSAGYAAYTAMTPVTSGQALTKDLWNTMVADLSDLDSRWSRAGSNLAFTGGNVGIGTTNPGAKLDITGSIKIANGTQGVGKILTSDANGVGSWTSPPSDTYGNNSYSAQNITLTTATQNFTTVMTLPSAGTYLIWITARVDLGPSSFSHFFLSTTPAGSALFGINYMNNLSTTSSLSTTYANMWVLSVSGPTSIYVGWTSGGGVLWWIGVWQSSAGYLKVK